MLYSTEQIKENLSSIDRQLLFMIHEQLLIQNDLLRSLTDERNQVIQEPVKYTKPAEDELDGLKRPELMKLMSKLPDKPQGFHRWETEDMRKHLKGVS